MYFTTCVENYTEIDSKLCMPSFIVGNVCIGPWLVMIHKAWYMNSPQAIVSTVVKLSCKTKDVDF